MAEKILIGTLRDFVMEFVDKFGQLTTVDPTAPVQRLEFAGFTAPDGTPSASPLAELVGVAADQLSGSVSGLGAGTCQLQADVDVDRGDGVKTINLVADLEIAIPAPGEAVAGVIRFREVATV